MLWQLLEMVLYQVEWPNEGLNTIATLGSNAIIIINDNDQSIAKKS